MELEHQMNLMKSSTCMSPLYRTNVMHDFTASRDHGPVALSPVRRPENVNKFENSRDSGSTRPRLPFECLLL